MLIRIYLKTIAIFELLFFPLLVLLMRLWMAMVFWNSGLAKITNWSSTILLFKEEYNVPVISPEFAAYMSATVELTCPILLVLGFATRFATIPMLVMTAVIQFTYFHSLMHLYWAFLFATILFYGPGKFSIDAWMRKKLEPI